MAWWIAVFKDRDGSTEELEVSTSTTLQYEAWNKVTTMFPNKELLQLRSGDELPTTLESGTAAAEPAVLTGVMPLLFHDTFC